MTNKTNEQMMKEWVQAGIDGGWTDGNESLQLINTYEHTTSGVIVMLHSGDDTKGCYFHKCIEQLIADGGFMTAVYGEECACAKGVHVNSITASLCGDCFNCEERTDTYRYHALEALKILLDKGNAVKYLWENMKKETL